MIKAIIFDCFGVIITDALKLVVDELRATKPEAAQQIVEIIHDNNRGLIEPTESNRQIAEILGMSVAGWRERIDSGEVEDIRLLTYIRKLRARGYKTALLSNIGRQSLHRRFVAGELQRSFDSIIVSAELGIMKPQREIYLYAARELVMAPADCLMVDDRETHCSGAVAAGMAAVLYKGFEQGRQDIERLLTK